MTGSEPQIGIENGLVDGSHDVFLPRLDDNGAGVGSVDVGCLANLGGCAVIINLHTVEHAGVSLSRTDFLKFLLKEMDGGLHAVFCLVDTGFR